MQKNTNKKRHIDLSDISFDLPMLKPDNKAYKEGDSKHDRNDDSLLSNRVFKEKEHLPLDSPSQVNNLGDYKRYLRAAI